MQLCLSRRSLGMRNNVVRSNGHILLGHILVQETLHVWVILSRALVRTQALQPTSARNAT